MAQNMIMNTSSLHSQDRTKEQDEEKEDFE